MFQFLSSLNFRKRVKPENGISTLTRNVSSLLLLMFTIGVLTGGAMGFYSTAAELPADIASYISPDVLPRSLPDAFWNSGKFFLLLLFLSTSWLGVVLSPAVVFLRGYLLSCSVSALFSAWSWMGLRYAALVSGIPALFLIPAFVVAAHDAFFASRRLLELRLGHGSGLTRSGLARRVFVIALLICLNAFYSFYILPPFLTGV